MNIETVKKWLDKNLYLDNRFNLSGNLNYFDNHNFTCITLTVRCHEYNKIKRYLNRYIKSIVYELDYHFGLSCWIFRIYNRHDYESLKEYSYFQKTCVSECEQYIHEHLKDDNLNEQLKQIMKRYEKRYVDSLEYGTYKKLTA